MTRYATAVLLCIAAAAVAGQSPVAPSFEVVSIKVNASADENFGFTLKPGGMMVATNVTARQIVTFAYSMQNSRVEDGPAWLDSVRFDITAKAAGPATQEQMLPMMRALLADRFRLEIHRDARDTPVFALVRARADGRLGPQLRPSATLDCDAALAAQARGAAIAASDGRPICGGRTRAGVITAGAVSMEELARNMSRLAGRMIIDRTGLPGRYDFDLKFTPEGDLTATPAARNELGAPPSLFVALEEQLGLKLESQRAPVEVVVIDSIQRPVED